jgi:acylphosphatase
MPTQRLRIAGRVQGVGFRYALQSEAERLGLAGWVRNRSDGSVEALLQGEAEAVESLTAWARHGPPGARVTEIHASTDTEVISGPGFQLRATV